jgi:CRISPR-associated protein Cmr6
MSTPNLGWLYYRDLYNDQREAKVEIDGKPQMARFSFDFLKKEKDRKPSKEQEAVLKMRSQQFFNKKISEYTPGTFFKCEAVTNGFELTTTYPGLLCGVGYNHGISSESDFKVGFYFDHTTGLPVIPGSSVKGVLRSAFPGYIRLDEDKKPSKEKMEERYKFFRWLIEEVNRKENAGIARFSNKEIDVLEAFIFEGQDDKGEQISYYQRDRFFDAYPVKSLEKDGYFLKNDYITPHINRDKPEMSPFTSPNPIQFLKVLPQIQFQFQFKLEDFKLKDNDKGLTVKQKEFLFKEILCFMGAGAKTNVGYGQFAEGFLEGSINNKPINASLNEKTEPLGFNGKIKEGLVIEAVVTDSVSKRVEAMINGQKQKLEMATRNCPEVGSIVLVEVKSMNKKREITQVGLVKQLK